MCEPDDTELGFVEMELSKENKLSELIVLHLQGESTAEEFEHLKQLLEQETEAVELYVEHMIQYSVLKQPGTVTLKEYPEETLPAVLDPAIWKRLSEFEKSAPAIEIEKPIPEELSVEMLRLEKPSRKISKFSIFSAILSVAAVLFVLVYVKFVPPAASTVATIADSLNAQWLPSKHPTGVGSILWNNEGTRTLQKGIVKIEFDYGAVVIIEGPTEFELQTGKQMVLHRGRLHARVTEDATGFIVDTPNSTVVDLGTEFGVSIHDDGSTDVHMLDGRASLIPGANGEKTKGSDLIAGQARRVDDAGEMYDIKVNPSLFVHEICSETRTVWRGESFSLASIVAGEDGFTDGDVLQGIDPATGKINLGRVQGYGRVGEPGYNSVPSSHYVDGVFVPNGDLGANAVSSAGHIFDGFPSTNNNYWSDVTAFPVVLEASSDTQRNPVKVRLTGMKGLQGDLPLIYLNTNAGITFDLKKIRESLPWLEMTEFTSTCGIPSYLIDSNKVYSSEFWVLIDGVKVFHHKFSREDTNNKEIKIPIKPQDQFLTLATTDGGDRIDNDWCLFVNPELNLVRK